MYEKTKILAEKKTKDEGEGEEKAEFNSDKGVWQY
jgi:hypothetical protein